MTILRIDDIKEIHKNKKENGGGYLIVFKDNRSIHIRKRRTIPALLTLIKHGEGCENDLTSKTDNLKNLKIELGDRVPSELIQDSYSDANKPFSELWNEEGFVFIQNTPGMKRQGSQKYVLAHSDHDKLFTTVKNPERKPPNSEVKSKLLSKHSSKCNLCGSLVKEQKYISKGTYYRDRVRLVWDHRIPVEKGGDSSEKNYQPLCFACNKHKWQVCSHCEFDGKTCSECVLANRELTSTIKPTGEDISDRLG
ncbi:HNH endonuclease [Microbulbifer sp. CnH-101-G]|uniref:HNH endonuclease n=1 Tax=Microbulbifer sp. CnH-101-G TaxID=3243393 RepID=UPI004039B108